MAHPLLLSRLVLSLAVPLFLQGCTQKASEPAPQQEGAEASSGAMQGCVFLGDRPVLQTSDGVTYELQGEAGQFAEYRDKLVEVQGRSTTPESNLGTDLPQLQVDSLRVVSETCPFHPASAADLPGAPGTDTQRQEQPNVAAPQHAAPGMPQKPPADVGKRPNQSGATGAPSPGTGNPPPQSEPPHR